MPAAVTVASASTAQIEEGIALHALLERLSTSAWPSSVPEPGEVARWIGCPSELARTVSGQARRIFGAPALQRFFDPACFIAAHNELEVVADGALLRMDRVVVYADEVWVLDYKRDLLDSERSAYAAQLQRYCAALAPVYARQRLRAAVITAAGELTELV